MDELVERLRDFAVELRRAEDALLVRDAADALEELQETLCNWCAVCHGKFWSLIDHLDKEVDDV